MEYISTRNKTLRVKGSTAILEGLSPDGGLYVPESVPVLSLSELERLAGLSYVERAANIMKLYLDEFSREELLSFAEQAYSSDRFQAASPAPVKAVGGDHMLELWHGPTCAFKDMALQMLPHLLSAALQKSGSALNPLILTATSGDTGKAALEGFKDVARTKIMVFYPVEGVSEIQKLQMQTQEGANVFVQAVHGNFDDAQSGVKQIFTDLEMIEALEQSGWKFSSANSINWGRLLPQIVYYVSAYCDMVSLGAVTMGDPVHFCVPTGNFGNILAAFYAKKMGLPIGKLLCASNSNNVLTDFIRTGTYDRNRPFFTTISPSMDILISSNLERLLFDLSGQDDRLLCSMMDTLKSSGRFTVPGPMLQEIQSLLWSGFAGEEETRSTIQAYWNGHRYLADPHTAVALYVKSLYQSEFADKTPIVTVSTANPYKFSEDVLQAIGSRGKDPEDLFAATAFPIPEQIRLLRTKPVRFSGAIDKTSMASAVLGCIQ